MSLITSENIDELINSVPGLRQQLVAEQMEPDTDPIPQLSDQLLNFVDERFPVNNLNDTEMEELSGYLNRDNRLAPIEDAAPYSLGSARIAGNPYSLDTRGAATSVRNAITGIVNKVREKRRDGYSDRRNVLADKKITADTNAAKKQAFYEKHYPDLLKKDADLANDAADRTATADRYNEDRTSRENIAKWNNDADIKLENLRGEKQRKLQELRNESPTGGGGGPSVQLMRDYVQSANAEIPLVEKKLDYLYDLKSNVALRSQWENNAPEKPDGGSYTLDEYINETQEYYQKLNRDKADMIIRIGNVSDPGAGNTGKYDDL